MPKLEPVPSKKAGPAVVTVEEVEAATTGIHDCLRALHAALTDPHAAAVTDSFAAMEALEACVTETLFDGDTVAAPDAVVDAVASALFGTDAPATGGQAEGRAPPPSLLRYISGSFSPEAIAGGTVPTKAVQHGLQLLATFVGRVRRDVHIAHATAARKQAMECFIILHRVAGHQTVQAAALALVQALVEAKALPTPQSADCRGVLDVVLRAAVASSVGQTVKARMLRLAGSLSLAFPVDVAPISGRLLKLFVQNLEAQARLPEPETTAAEGLLLGFSDFLANFATTVDEGGAELLAKLYAFVKATLHMVTDSMAPALDAAAMAANGGPGNSGDPTPSALSGSGTPAAEAATGAAAVAALSPGVTRYAMVHAALQLLRYHASLLKEFLTEDALDAVTCVATLCRHKNVELHKKAYPGAAAVVQAVAFELCTSTRRHPHANQKTLVQLLSKVKGLLHSGGRYEVSFALSSLGLLARPIAKFASRADLSTLLDEMAYHFELLFGRGHEEVEEATKHLSQYIHAFACLLLELGPDDITPQHVEAVHSVLHTTLLLFPKQFNFPKLRLATPGVVLRLLLACTRLPALHDVLPTFVQRAVLLTISSSSVFSAANIAAAVPEGTEQGGASTQSPPGSQGPVLMSQPGDGTAALHPTPFATQGGAQVGVEDPAALAPDAVPHEAALFEEFDILWRGILAEPSPDVLEHWGFPWLLTEGLSATAVKHVVSALRAAVLQAAMDTLQPLDLSCRVVVASGPPALDAPATFAASAAASQVPQPQGVTAAERAGVPVYAAHQSTLATAAAAAAGADNAATALAPTTPKDYSLFLNLVAAFERLVATSLAASNVDAWGAFLIQQLVEKATAAPHASGVYSMLAAVLRAATDVGFFSEAAAKALPAADRGVRRAQRKLAVDVLQRFLADTLRGIGDFRDELLASALTCILAFPVGVPRPRQMVAPLRSALRMGSEYEPLAVRALEVLTLWLHERQREAEAVLLPALASLLARYVEHAQDSSAVQRHLIGVVARSGSVIGDALRSDEAGQGHEHGDDSDDDEEGPLSSSVGQPLLRLWLPFRDTTVAFSFDTILPRVLRLARQAQDRKTRTAACELLHSLVVWVVGSSAQRSGDDASSSVDYSPALQRMLPTVLRLAVSSDAVPRQLFGSLVQQLVRWFAQAPGAEAGAVLDAVCEGLGAPADAALRTLCARCLADFQAASIRSAGSAAATSAGTAGQPGQASLAPAATASVGAAGAMENARHLYRRLFSMCSHPSVWKRLGAAVALNQLYVEFREVDALVSEHVLDVLYYAFNALAGCDSAVSAAQPSSPESASAADLSDDSAAAAAAAAMGQLKQVLGHMEKVIVFRAALLVDPPQGAATRAGSRFASLREAVEWLLEQSGCVETEARHVAMRLFATLCSCLPGFDTDDGPMRWLAAHRQTHGVGFFAGMFAAFSVTDPERVEGAAAEGTVMSLGKYAVWAREIEAALECHDWLLSARFLPPHVAFGRRGQHAPGIGPRGGDAGERALKKQRHDPSGLGGLGDLGGIPVDLDDDEPAMLVRDTHGGKRGRGEETQAPPTVAAEEGAHLPQSHLLKHAFYFLRHMAGDDGSVAKLRNTGIDSQNVWLQVGASQPTQPSQPDAAADSTDGGVYGALSAEAAALVAQRRLGVLEALVPLLESLLGAHPTACWLPSDPEVRQQAAHPVLHPALYDVAAVLLLQPRRVLGPLATDPALAARGAAVAGRLCKVLWRTVSRSPVFHSERPAVVAALERALPWSPSDAAQVAHALQVNVVDAVATIRGLRALYAEGALLDVENARRSAARAPGSKSSAAAHRAGLTLPLLAQELLRVVQLLVAGPDVAATGPSEMQRQTDLLGGPSSTAGLGGGPVAASMGQLLPIARSASSAALLDARASKAGPEASAAVAAATQPLAQQCLRDLAALALSMPLPVEAFVSALVDAAPAHGFADQDADASLAALSAASATFFADDGRHSAGLVRRTTALSKLSAAAVLPTGTRGARLLRLLPKEIEAFAARNSAAVLRALLPARRMNRALVFECALLLCGRFARAPGPSPELEEFLREWAVFCRPADGEADDFELVDLRLAAAQLLLAADPGATLRHCRAILEDDVALCLGAGLVATATSAAPSQATSAAGTPATPGTPHRHGAPGGLAREAPLFAQGTPPPPARAYQPFSRHCLLKAKRGVRLLRTACAVAPWLFGTVQQRRRAALNAVQRRDAAAAQAQQDQHRQYMQAEYGVGGLTPAPGRTAPSTPYAKSDPSSHRSTDRGPAATPACRIAVLPDAVPLYVEEAVEDTPFAHRLVAAVEAIVNDELPVTTAELREDSTESDAFSDVTASVLDLVGGAPVPALLFAVLPLSRHRALAGRFHKQIAQCVQGMRPAALAAACRRAVATQQMPLPRDIRLAVTQRVLLPALQAMPPLVCEGFFADEVRALTAAVADAATLLPDVAAVTNNDACAARACAFALLEAMYRLCSTEALKGSINHRFTGTTEAAGKELTEKVIRGCVAVRSMPTPAGAATSASVPAVPTSAGPDGVSVDAAAVLQLRQAAHSCLVSVVIATQRAEKLFVQFLLRERTTGPAQGDLWHQVTDLAATHSFDVETNFPRRRDALRELRASWDDAVVGGDGSERSVTAEGEIADGAADDDAASRKARRTVARMKYLASCYLADSHLDGGSPQHAAAITASLHGTPGVAAAAPVTVHSVGSATPTPQTALSPGAGDKRQGAALTSIAAHKQSLLQSLHADLARSGRARTPAVPKAGAAPAMDTASQDSAHGLHAGLHAVPQSQLGVVGGSQWGGASAGLVSEGAAAPGGTVEVDSVWRSCCTAAVLRLVDHLTALFPPPNYAQLAAYCPGLKVAPAPSSGVGPGLWPRELVKVLCDETGAHANVRLLVLRVVTLRPHLFAPYANELFCPVVRLTLDPKLGRGVHYVARDVIHTFLLWHMMATTPPPQPQPLAPGAPAPAAVPGLGQLPPLSQEGDVAAAHVMSFLVRNASHHARHILRENLELTRCVVEQWRHRAVVSKADLLGWLAYDPRQTSARAARMCGVQLCGVVVANSLPLYNVRTDATTVSEDNFYRRLAANMERQAKDLACAAAEVCGRALAVMAALSTPAEDRAAVLRGVVSHRLQSVLHMDTPERFVLLLHKAATHHAPVVDEFLPAKLLGLWSRVPAPEQGLILEMLAMRAEHHAEAMYRAVTAQLFSASARFTPLQVVGLCTLLRAVAPYLEARDDAAHLVRSWLVILAPGPSSTAGAAESKADAGLPSLLLDARMAYYSLCIYLYDTFGPAAATANPAPAPSGPQSATGKGLLTGEQRTSLGQRIAAGFGDEALVVRDLVLRFWDNEARLPCGGVDRFHAVFTTFGGSQLGPQWLQCAAILLLYATHRSPDFARPDALFPHPLTQCQYHQAEINTSGRAAHSLPLTPMFATQAHIPVSQLPSLPASLGGDAGTARAAARRDPAHAAAAGSALTWIASQQQPGRTSPQPGHGVAQVLSQRLRFFQATQHQGQSQDAGAAPQATFAPYGGSLTLATAAATPTSSLLWVQQTGMPSPAGEPGAASQGAGSGLRRRFRKVQEGHKVRRHILHASALRRQKTLHEQRLRDEQHSRVSVFRTYRDGEVPDVQLALQAFVVPLQALCLYDHQTAATALSTLSDAFFAKTAALCGATPGGTGSNSATVPVPGLSVSAGAPASFTMFAEVQPQLAPQQVAVVRSDIFAALRRDLKTATSPAVVRFVHERLLDDAAATDPADVFASAAASGAFPTAVLLLEAIFEAVERRLADATRRAQQRGDSGSGNGSVTTVSGGAALAVAAASAVEAAGLRQQRATTLALLYSAWKHCPGGDDQALLTAARYMPDPAAFKTVVAELRRGNLDAATKAAAAYIAAAERPVAPTGDDDPIARQQALVLSTARFEHRQALLQGLQFDDVSDAFSALAQQQDEADALWAPGHAHELSQLIVSRSRSTRPAARQALLAQLDQSGAAATLERPLLLFEERRFAAACRACDSGLSDALRRWVAVPGAAADPAALGALQNLLTLRDAASTLSNRRLDAARFAAQAVRALGDWGAAAPLDDLGTPDPRQWHDTLWVRGTVADAYAERLDALRDDAAPAPLLELWAGAYPTLPPCPKVGALAGDIARHAGAVASHRLAAAAGAASLGAPRRAVAAKRFLQTATTMTEAIAPGHAFDMGVWRSVVLSTMQRACDVLELSGDALRKTFGDIQSHVKAKAAKLGLETGIARDRVAYALLQCEFWAALSRRLVASEGAACEQEVVPMINKSYKKFAVAVAASGGAPGSAVSSQADPDAAASGEGSLIPAATSLAVAQYCTDMVAFLARNEDPAAAAMATPTGTQEGAGAHQTLRSSLATVATTQLLASLEHHGSDDARRMFPRLLPLLHESQDARDALAQRAPLISTWLVLPWIGQLVSALLGAVPVAATVAPLLSRVAAHYPQVAFYPYNCIREELEAHVVALTKDPRYNRNIAHSQDSQLYTQHVGAIASAIATLRAIAQDDLTGKLRLFCSSLHKLHHPELRLRAWWDDIKAELARFRDATRSHDGAAAQAAAAKAQQLWRECWKDCFDHTAPGIGSYNRKFARSYAAKAKQKFCDPSTAQGSGSGALSMDYDRFRRTATLLEEARQGLQFKDKMGLAAFSEALAGVQLTAHSAAAVELPQQPFTFLATMGPVPMPTVAAVDHTLLVMGSVQKPKRLTVTTSDVRRHMLLVKGGDDVRLDQRLEQLFSCVNAAVAESLREDAGTRSLAPVLRIRTYSVIPVDKKVGLVEWVDGTEPMKRTIERSMHNDSDAPGRDPTVEAHPATKAYHDFVGRMDGGNKEMTLYQRYLAMFRLVRNRAGEHTARVGEWKGLVKGAYLRDGLTAMAPDRAGWYDVRQRFTHTTAALSAAGYVLGVGDRHLQNCLIDKRTGDAIPIDFGHAFGSATMLLGIPELMPFRMTPQMVLALGPLGADAVAPSMVRTLQAVRRKKSLLLGIMNAFLSEPLVAWEKEAAAAHSGGHQLTVTGLARRRLDTVQRKIDMVHPVTIMSEEVAANAHVERAKLREFVTAVLQGEPVKREGAQQLTGVEQQVQLLLEMATDDNILGRTWVGWSPLF